MKRLLSLAIVSVAMVALLTGCSDGSKSLELTPDIVASGVTVTKADLINGLWGTEEVSPDVTCLLGSSFTVTSETPFSLAKNSNPGDFNQADVIVISTITVTFDDLATDGRGATCGEGTLQYLVQASDEAPLDIETSKSLRPRHSLEHMVSGSSNEYPGCTIRAHFDKSGTADCDATDDVEEPEAEDDEDDETPEVPEVTPEPEDDGDDEPEIGPFIPVGVFTLKAARVSEDGVPCGDEDIQSVKMVVDDYNCQLQGYQPRQLQE